MRRGTRRVIATWLGVAALLCQILLPLGVARLADATGLGVSTEAQTEHHHDPDLANSLGAGWASGHSHAGDTPSGRVRLDLASLTPVTLVDPPQPPAVILHWVAFVPDRMAPAPAGADDFSRPLPRAPPLPV